MDERLQFVARRLAGEPMAELCREFGISRKTGYKIFDRYQECGIQGLTDRSRRPYRYAHQLFDAFGPLILKPKANRIPCEHRVSIHNQTQRQRASAPAKQAYCL
jgi:putative transposase